MSLLSSDAALVPRRAVRASVALLGRQGAVQGLNVIAGMLLARWLPPSEFGVWAIVSFVLTALTAVGDLGLGAGLVREAREPDERDYRAVLACQHALALVLGTTLWLAAPAVAAAYHLGPAGVTLFRLVAATLPITAFQTVATIRLERALAFGRITTVEVAQAVAYTATLLGMISAGAGLPSFGVALLVRAVVGAGLATGLARARPGWRVDVQRIRHLLAFGLPYQGIGLVSLLKDSLIPIVVGGLLGTAAVGQVFWAQMVAAYPVLALMAMQRVYLPSFARLQEDTARLGRLLENVLRMTAVLVAPFAVLTLALAEPAVRIVFGETWRPALPLFRLLWVANLVVPVATPLVGLLNALGRSRTTFAFSLLWMVVTWGLGVPGLLAVGLIGFGLANIAVQITGLSLIPVARRHVAFRIAPAIAWPWGLAAIVGAALAGGVALRPPVGIVDLVAYAAAALLLYALGIGLVWRERLVRVFRELTGGAE